MKTDWDGRRRRCTFCTHFGEEIYEEGLEFLGFFGRMPLMGTYYSWENHAHCGLA
jgi:hypothetical protein